MSSELADGDGVAVPVGQADAALVDAGELLAAVVEPLLLDRAAVAVEMPALQRGRSLGGPRCFVRNMDGWRTTSSTMPSPSGSSKAFIGWNT